MRIFQRRRNALLLVLCVAALHGVTLQGAAVRGRATREAAAHPNRTEPQRLAPPASVKCPHNDLTVYEGRVLAYRRDAARTFLRIRTDAETTESVVVRHRRERTPLKWFLLRAEPFKASDWKVIERTRGRLRPGVRVHAWVCTDGTNPVVDWQPPVE